MTVLIRMRLQHIYRNARHEVKGNYNTYVYYKRLLDPLGLDSVEYSNACRTLSNILGI